MTDEDMKIFADDVYFKLGWRPIPIKGKKPTMQKWQQAHLTAEEFRANWRSGDNIGIVTGWLGQGKFALMALDVDQGPLIGFNAKTWLEKGAMAHTTSGDPRIVFYTDKAEVALFSKKVSVLPGEVPDEQKPLLTKKAEGKESIVVFEVLGEGRQFMAPPSTHPDTGVALTWIVPPKPAEETLLVHSLADLKSLLEQSITRNKWVLEELFETSKAEAESDATLLRTWLEKIKVKLDPAGETTNYLLFHCPFHRPDSKPSFVVHKAKFYAYDYHDDKSYSLKALAEKLGGKLGLSPKTKKRAADASAAVEVGDTFTYTGDRPFLGRIQVAALGFPQSRYLRLTFHCAKATEECPACDLASNMNLNFESSDMDPSAFATYFDTNMGRDALRILVERGIKLGCPAWWNSVICTGEDERAVTQAVVMDQTGTEGRAWFVHGAKCDLKRTPNWVIAEGWLCKGKMGKIGVLVYAFTPESEVAAPRPEDVEKAKLKLRSLVNWDDDEKVEESVLWKTAEALQRQSQLKGSEIVKGYVSDLLTIASPVWVKTPEGPPQLGATTCELGPTTTAKSLRIRMLNEWLESGKYDTGKKTPAGLTAGAEKAEGIGWILRKGLLPSMDLSWLVIDNMWPHALDNQIESRRDGVVTITAIRNAELWARCRLKLLSNPFQPFDEVLYKCTALKVYDSKFIARFAFALFTYGVSTEERYSKKINQPLPGDAEILEAVKIVLKWNLSKETTFTVPEAVWPIIMDYGKKLEETFGCEDIPLLLRSNPYKLACLAYSFALLEGTSDPTDRHVRLAYEWLDFCARNIELDKYVEWWRSQHLLSDEDFNATRVQIESEVTADSKEHGGSTEETYTFKLMQYLAKNEKGQRDELAAYLDVDAKTVSRKANLLKGLGVLRSDMDGYHFTAKGVRFLKRWFNGRVAVPNVPNVPTSEGHRQISVDGTMVFEKAAVSPEVPVTPKTGDMRDIKDMKNETVHGQESEAGSGTVQPPIIFSVKKWCDTHKDERGEVSLFDLADFIEKELGQDPRQATRLAFQQAILMPSPKPGKAVVV
jgi:hypothetical protein